LKQSMRLSDHIGGCSGIVNGLNAHDGTKQQDWKQPIGRIWEEWARFEMTGRSAVGGAAGCAGHK
jgi:hypothetical protein